MIRCPGPPLPRLWTRSQSPFQLLRASLSMKLYSLVTHRILHPSQDTSSKRNAESVDTTTAGVRWTVPGKPGPVRTQPFGTGSHGTRALHACPSDRVRRESLLSRASWWVPPRSRPDTRIWVVVYFEVGGKWGRNESGEGQK